LEKRFTKKGWWGDSRCRPWVQAPVLQKKKKNNHTIKILAFTYTNTYKEA
jgi:hypothetical protein